jgi:hypothetical protein
MRLDSLEHMGRPEIRRFRAYAYGNVWSLSLVGILAMVFLMAIPSSAFSAPQEGAPYPPSPVVTDLTFDFSTHVRMAQESDNWPVTWAGDDHQYTAWGDGWGFSGDPNDTKASLGVSRIEGGASNYQGFNIWGGTNAQSQARFDGKSYGIISIDGVLYMWVGPGSNTKSYAEARLAKSADYGATWTKTDWAFVKSQDLIMPTILQFGKDYAGSRDNYVYHYFIRLKGNPDKLEIHVPGEIDLARVPKDQMMNEDSYEFFAGLDGNGSPTWSTDPSQRKPVFEDPNGVGWTVAVSYNQGLQRYILTTEHTDSFSGNLGIFDAPEPWGPWTTVAYYNKWNNGEPTFFWNFSNKWLSADGKDFTLIYTGINDNDSWNTVRGSFTVSASGPANQAPSVNAGSDQTITLPSGVSLDGNVNDDALPNGTLTTTWSKASGPGSVTFGNANEVDTTASFSQNGTYVLRLGADDGALSSSDDITITVNPEPPSGPNCPMLTGLSAQSQDLDSDGKCEDINGNGRLDFDDVVEFFQYLDTSFQQSLDELDFNGNQSEDMQDVVTLFDLLIDTRLQP